MTVNSRRCSDFYMSIYRYKPTHTIRTQILDLMQIVTEVRSSTKSISGHVVIHKENTTVMVLFIFISNGLSNLLYLVFFLNTEAIII